MKNIAMHFGLIMLTIVLTNITFAQTLSAQKSQTYPRIMESKLMSERLQRDLKKRNPNLQTQPIQWFELGDGFYGSYESEDNKFMTMYDRDGNYIQTYKKSDWNNASASLRAAYDMSAYKTQPVLNYWEVYDADKKGYFLELNNEQGKVLDVWVNEAGEFSTSVPKTKTKS